MKNVLYMHHVSSIGGASFCLLSILKEIDRKVINPIVLLKEIGPLKDQIENLGIKVYIFPEMLQVPYNRPLIEISSIRSYYKFSNSRSIFDKWLKKNNINVVYINTMMLYPYLEIAKNNGVKTIIHIREHWPLDQHKMQLKWAQDAIKKYADVVIAINKYSASMIPEVKDKTTIVYDWIDMDSRYEYRPLNEIFCEDTSNLKVYLFTGGVVSLKGGLTIAKTFIHHIKDLDARLLMLGVDTEIVYNGWYGMIRKMLSWIGIYSRSDQLRLIVRKDKRIKCIPSSYAIKHIIEQSYCMLSFFTIPHANLALAECLILKTPVVAAETPESIEYSNNMKLNTLFMMNNKTDLIEKIKYLNNHYNEEKKVLEKLSGEVRQQFDKKINILRINEIINKI